MLLGSIEQLPFRLLALLIGLTIHEFCHAATASYLGDMTARRLGRVSLNPVRHLDPMGTVLIFLVGFGWGKPVPVNAAALRRGRRGMAAVAAAGPLSNLLTATVAAIPFRLDLLDLPRTYSFTQAFSNGPGDLLSALLVFVIVFNIILAMLNLIPLFPLDGSNVALGLLPIQQARSFARLERYGPGILMMVIGADFIFRIGILRAILGPVVNYVSLVILGERLF